MAGVPILLAVRPERIRIGAPEGAGTNALDATLGEIVFQGSKVHLHFAAAGGQSILVEAGQLPENLGVGGKARLSWSIDDTLVFPDEQAQ